MQLGDFSGSSVAGRLTFALSECKKILSNWTETEQPLLVEREELERGDYFT